MNRILPGRIRAWYRYTHGLTKLALVLIGGLYAASFFMPVSDIHACTPTGIPYLSGTLSGWDEFRLIMAAPFDPYSYTLPQLAIIFGVLAWLANPIVWVGFVGIIREEGPLVTAAGLAAFVFAFAPSIDFKEMKIENDYHYGYHAWLLSMLTMAFFGVWLMLAERSRGRACHE
jgi:hypothetical protein